MNRGLLLCALVLLAGCVHRVHSLKVDDETRAMVEEELRAECPNQMCSVDRCWMETEDVPFCLVEFSFVTSWHQSKALSQVAARLQDRGLPVGLCGRESAGSQLIGAFLSGFASGAVSSALGVSTSVATDIDEGVVAPSGEVAKRRELSERLYFACMEGVSLVETPRSY